MRLDVRNTRSQDGEHIWKTTDQFLQTYWSGLDARVFANDHALVEILSLSWQLSEAVAPCYNYAHYTYTQVMHGAREVRGQFTINFISDAYVFALLASLQQDATSNQPVPSPNRDHAYQVAAGGQATLADFAALASRDGSAPIGSDGRLKVDPKLLSQVAEDFTRAQWGDRERAPGPAAITAKLLPFASLLKPRFQLSQPLDLNIVFGSAGDQTDLARRQLASSVGADQLDPKGPVVYPLSTATKLVGVHLTGMERSVDDSGRPVLETYSFLARDVV